MNTIIGNLAGSDEAVIEAAYPGEYMKFTRIGRGSYACVYKAETTDGQVVAIKVIDLKNMQKEIIPYMQNEIKLLSESDNKNVIKLFKSQQTHDKLILILEYCQLDVEFMVKRYYKGKLTDDLAIVILRQLVNGLHYLHMNKIIHRDLKLENFAIHMSNEDYFALQNKNDLSVFERATYKLIDLGLAKKLENLQAQTSTWAGTELNMAPEILNEQKYSFQADMYSLGVCLYYMLCGKYPYFDATNRTPLQDLIKKENADVNQIANLQLRSLIQRMLKYDPKQRITFQELYQHDFFKFREGDLSNPIDLELKENQIIYSQQIDQSILEYDQKKQQNENSPEKDESKSDFKKLITGEKQDQVNKYIEAQQSGVFPQIPIQTKNNLSQTKIYDNQKKEDDQIMQLYHTRNQYIAILKLADYIEEMIPLVKQTKLTFLTMESKFNMYIEYLRMVSKQIFIKLQQRFQFYQPTLGSYDRYLLLEKQVKGEDNKRLQNITVREGASTGIIASLRKSVFKQIQCEPNDSMDFIKQYEQINIELYKELLSMIQATYYHYQKETDPKVKKVKCLIYLAMIDTARSRVLFKIDQKNIDYKIEELLLAKAKEEPDILQEKITSILGQYNLKYD